MNKDLASKRYSEQRSAAHGRGIPWQFTFESWIAWWEGHLGPDWMKKRGTRRGQFVMARHNDEGPYHPNNVKCILQRQNVADARQIHLERKIPWGKGLDYVLRGENHHSAKLTEQMVKDIYLSTLSTGKLAILYGVSKGCIREVRSGLYWGHVTGKLTRPLLKKFNNLVLTPSQVLEIYKSKLTQNQLAKKYKCSRTAVSDIKRGHTWQHVTQHLR